MTYTYGMSIRFLRKTRQDANGRDIIVEDPDYILPQGTDDICVVTESPSKEAQPCK